MNTQKSSVAWNAREITMLQKPTTIIYNKLIQTRPHSKPDPCKSQICDAYEENYWFANNKIAAMEILYIRNTIINLSFQPYVCYRTLWLWHFQFQWNSLKIWCVPGGTKARWQAKCSLVLAFYVIWSRLVALDIRHVKPYTWHSCKVRFNLVGNISLLSQ